MRMQYGAAAINDAVSLYIVSLSLPLSLSLSLSHTHTHFGRFIRYPLQREINLIAGESERGGFTAADPITPPSTLTAPPSLHNQSGHV